jgi:hypothetical protein
VTINVTTNSFPLIQITWPHVEIRILVIFSPVHFAKYKHYNRSFILVVRLRFDKKDESV